jgi:hypothetical protein
MSAIIILGVPLVIATAVALSETEIVAIIKELITLLVKTTDYTTDKIVQIIRFYQT